MKTSKHRNNRNGRPNLATDLFIVLVALVVGAVAGQDFLPDRYRDVPDIATYTVAVFVIWRQSTICIRLARTVEQREKLFSMRFWVGFTVISLLLRVGDVYRPTGQHAVRFATEFGLLMAFLATLRLVECLLTSNTHSLGVSIPDTYLVKKIKRREQPW